MPSSIDNYEVLGPIGSGTFATCKKVRRKKDGRVLVWKEIEYSRLSEDAKQMLVLEVNLLRELRHDNIVRYYDRVVDRTNSTLYIVMEYCEGGDLASYIKKMKASQSQVAEDFVWRVCHQIASALSECHSRSRNGNSVLHRDLKPANIFLDARNNAKIGDFGLARVLKPNTQFTKTCVGTPYYMSPELLTGAEYNDKSDVWSLGCVLYELCALRPPFNADCHLDLVKNVTSGQLQRIPACYSNDLFTLISTLLQVNHTKRLSIGELLSHPLLLARFFPSRPDNTLTHPLQPSTNHSDRAARDADLQARELHISQRETELDKRAAELDAREKRLNIREKMTEERMARAERLLEEYAEAKLALMSTFKTTATSDRESDDDTEDDDAETISRHNGNSNSQVNSRGHSSRNSTSSTSAKTGRKSHHSGRHRENPTSSSVRRNPSSRENRGCKLTAKQSEHSRDGRCPLGTISQQDNLVVLGQRALPPLPYEYSCPPRSGRSSKS